MFLITILNFIAVVAHDKLRARSSGYMTGSTWRELFGRSLFALVALLFGAGTFGALYAVQTAGVLFVNSFQIKLLGFGILALFVGSIGGLLIEGGVCALGKK